MPKTKQDFQKELNRRFELATGDERYLTVTAGEIHTAVGDYPGTDNCMPSCCSVLRAAILPGDVVLYAPPKGDGAGLAVRYAIPRDPEAHAIKHHQSEQSEVLPRHMRQLVLMLNVVLVVSAATIATYTWKFAMSGKLGADGDGGFATVVAAIFGILITGVFLFMTFRIDRGAILEARKEARIIARSEALRAAKAEIEEISAEANATLRKVKNRLRKVKNRSEDVTRQGETTKQLATETRRKVEDAEEKVKKAEEVAKHYAVAAANAVGERVHEATKSQHTPDFRQIGIEDLSGHTPPSPASTPD